MLEYLQNLIDAAIKVAEEDPQNIHIRAWPTIIPFRGIKVSSSTGFSASISTNMGMSVDVAYEMIQAAVVKLRFSKVEENGLLRLLNRNVSNRDQVTDKVVIYALNHLHEECDLRVDYGQLKEEWAKEFDNELDKVNKVNPDRSISALRVQGAAWILLQQIARRYGGLGPKTCPKGTAIGMMNSAAKNSNTIEKEQFVKATEGVVQEILKTRFVANPIKKTHDLLRQTGPIV